MGEIKINRYLLKALDLIPHLETMKEENYRPASIYYHLRTAERAYEELSVMGMEVSEELKERRYQILELAIYVLENKLRDKNISQYIDDRTPEEIGEEFEMGKDLRQYRQDIIECAKIIDKYLRKIYPKSFKKEGNEDLEKLFPEP